MASQNIGSLGPRDGPVVRVNCPVGDSLRSVVGWFVVVLLLLLRKANRVKEAWALLVPLAVLYLALGVVERPLNAYLVFHYHQYICSALADLLRYFARYPLAPGAFYIGLPSAGAVCGRADRA